MDGLSKEDHERDQMLGAWLIIAIYAVIVLSVVVGLLTVA